MEDSYINNTSVDESHNYSYYINSTYDYNNYQCYNYDHTEFKFYSHLSNEQLRIRDVVLYIVTSISFPLILLIFYGVYSEVRNGQSAPIYIINLLISDLIQLCCLTVYVAKPENYLLIGISGAIYLYGVISSIGFMVCVALERYLVIAWPLWYRFRRNIKTSVVVCVVVWILPIVILVSFHFWSDYNAFAITLGVFHLLTLPLFIFFLFGTVRALSAAISVPPDEKRRIVAVLVLVLLIYTLLFLPVIIRLIARIDQDCDTFVFVTELLIYFSPLADSFLYVFSRKGAADTFLAFVCCCRMNSDSDISTIIV